ncbi:PP2C family protein-serine/threonine phosphatase [Fodinibius sp.]|uniref:PP2C family protein-serine/threonine phosphatase n=1 Tax=Fodinibius sp. TaxID=1872440 RepID=UPI002ACDAEAC|nr:PP2C family protein-serine/threonine phosphatase [Fodinibius sp.]MDZ7658281.1 PP2C family protein-serine/threonine phosphatase [Fodinibius sp.]
MSIIHKKTAFGVGDFVFIAVGLLCVFGFFLNYPSQEPRSIISTTLSQDSVKVKANQVVRDLGYSLDNRQASVIRFQSNTDLLDSLQYDNGRQSFIRTVSDSMPPGLHPYYWDVDFSNAENSSQPGEDGNENISVRLDGQGRLIEFFNPENSLPNRPVHRRALIHAFEAEPDLDLWKTLPDSAWDRVLRFDLDEDYNSYSTSDSVDIEDSDRSHTFTRVNIERLMDYYLQYGGWKTTPFEFSEIQIETVNSQAVADVTVDAAAPIMGQDVRINARLLSSGALLNFDANYNPDSTESDMPGLLEISRLSMILIFALVLIVLFYFRIRSRAIDTQSALIAGILTGLTVPATIFLQEWETSTLMSGNGQSVDLLGLALQMGFSGAFTSVGVFALFAVGDSIMRQYWPQKLYTYDYLRQGSFFNKPIGEMILRSMVLAFIVCGIWTIALSFAPNLFFEVERTFLAHEAAWSPIYLFLNSFWFSLLFALCIFAVAATQFYGSHKRKWLSSLVIILGVILIIPTFQNVGPTMQEMILFGILGIVFTVIFLKWDILTVFFTHFIFVLMLESSSGWIVSGSPDLSAFILLLIFLFSNAVAAVLFIVKGDKEQSLSGYVPEYVEELAQEQRIKQELRIARDVQQSFLPVETPRFKNLDLAAICKPAYETGGDYYDFVQLDDHRIAVTIGDVSGKGIQAAFYMTFIKGILQSLCHEIDSPAEILKRVNRLFYENAQRGTFISLVYGIIDLKKRTFRFARAGHNPILRVGGNNTNLEELKPKGIGIGLSKDRFDEHLEEVELSIEDKNVLVLYTDGIVEAMSESEKFYGTKRLNMMIKRNARKSAKEILDLVAKDVGSFIGKAKQHDDMTIMVMKLKDQKKNRVH